MSGRHLFLFAVVFVLAVISNAELRFKFLNQTNCALHSEIFISQNKKLIFQLPGVQGLDSSVHLNKGQYQVAVISPDCEFKTDVDVSDMEKTKEVTVAQQRSQQPRLPSSTGMSAELAMAQLPRGAFVPGGFNYVMPFWYPFVQQNYLNYQWPCLWSMFGCNSGYYPVQQHQLYPNGPIVMGKPNIYVQGPDSEKMRLVFLEKAEGRFMASTPAITENFWEFDLKGNGIFKNQIPLGYFFFDARTPTKADYNLDEALCGQKDELLKFMIEQLEKRKFPKTAVADFKQHWIFKFPDMESCLFPQTEKNIQSMFPLELQKGTEKTSVSYNRIYFVAVPRSAPVTQLPLKFKSNPKKWVDREPAAVKTYQVFEWGVGFLAH